RPGPAPGPRSAFAPAGRRRFGSRGRSGPLRRPGRSGLVSTASEVAFLARALKAPRISALASPLAERARAEGWEYEHYLAQVLSEEVSSRETHGRSARVKAARFPQVKTLDDFDFSFQRSVKRQQVAHLHQLDFLREAT